MNNLREQGKAILFVSHRMEEIFEIADRLGFINDLDISEEDKAKVFYKNAEIFLDH